MKKNAESTVEMVQYNSNLNVPGSINSEHYCCFDKFGYDYEEDPDETEYISEIHHEPEHLESHICHLLLGVATERCKIFGKDTDTYIEALSVRLLKEGKWKLSRDTVELEFSKRAIELIYEKDMTSKFEDGLWKDLETASHFAYRCPLWRKKVDVTCEEKEEEKDVFASPAEIYGLMFYALLKNEFYNGAKQLIETGYVRVPEILIGCVILQDVANDWRISPSEKEKLLKMQSIFSQQAIRITNCIHDQDNKQTKNQKKKEKGEKMFHTGRLLLNHGYLENAIKTQNKTYLYNSKIGKIINKMWYGKEELSIRRIVLFLLLALVHPILLLFLMVTLKKGPLKWFYDQYSLPSMKVFINMMGFVTILFVYAYMLLFRYSHDMSLLDIWIIGWMVSFFLDEIKQLIVAIKREKLKIYVSSWWNLLDWLSMITYASGMLCKLGSSTEYKDASKSILVFAFIMLSIRILNMFCISEILGPKLVSIRKMFKDTFAFMVIMAVIMICYNVSSYALLYPNSDFRFITLEKVMSNGYWMLFGENNLDTWNLAEPDCSFNKSVYQSGLLPRCPTQLGLIIAPYLKVMYGLIAVILMLNLLIAMYSDTFRKVHMQSEFHWSELQIDFLEEYSVKSIFPLHMQSLALIGLIIHCCLWFVFLYLTKKIYSRFCSIDDNNSLYSDDYESDDKNSVDKVPMFVRGYGELRLKTAGDDVHEQWKNRTRSQNSVEFIKPVWKNVVDSRYKSKFQFDAEMHKFSISESSLRV